MSINTSNNEPVNYLRINNSRRLYLNHLIPTNINNMYIELEDKINDNELNNIFIKNKYRIKNKEEFFTYFNGYNNTLLYKLINFYYIWSKNYNYNIDDKSYKDYRVDWKCQYENRILKQYYLSEIYLIYKRQEDNNFIKILNIAINLWNNLYIYYLNKSDGCNININTDLYNLNLDNINNVDNLDKIFYLTKKMNNELKESDIRNNNIVIKDDLINNKSTVNIVDKLIKDNMELYNKNIDIKNNINTKELELNNIKKNTLINELNDKMSDDIKNDNIKIEDDSIDNILKVNDIWIINIYYYLIIEVRTEREENKFILNNNFTNNEYPNILMKEKNKGLIYELKDTEDISIVGWYLSDKFIIKIDDIEGIDKIYYDNKIKVNIDSNLYVNILYEKNKF